MAKTKKSPCSEMGRFASSPCSLADFLEENEKSMNIRIKRAYEPPSPEDGQRFLVDRLWPRGIKKDDLVITEWLKDVAPSTDLRKWFAHDPKRWDEFCKRYRAELQSHPEAMTP